MKTLKQRIYEALSYTSLDYDTILNQLVSMFKDNLTNGAWDNISEADPMFIMMSLFAAHTDILNYMMDYRVLEGYMSTARERASMVRIANSAGYKIRSFRPATATYEITNVQPDDVDWVTINDFSQIINNNESWVYTQYASTASPASMIGEKIRLVQGVPLKLAFKPETIDQTTLTQIVTNQSIAIGTNDGTPASRLHIIYDADTRDDWVEVDTVIGKTAADMVYELNVDPYGTTYIKFPADIDIDTWKNNKVSFELDYIVTNGATTLSSPQNFLFPTNAIKNGEPIVVDVTLNYDDTFTRGSDPATPQEIKQGYADYRGLVTTLVTLNDYETYVRNQTVVPMISKVLIVDAQARSDGGDGDNAFEHSVGVYALKENNTELTPEEEEALLSAINELKVSGIAVTINKDPDNAHAITPVTDANSEIRISLSPMPSGPVGNDLKDFIVNYVNNKGIGSTLTVTELYNLILNSKYASHYSNGITIKINSTETSKPLKFNEFFKITSSNIE